MTPEKILRPEHMSLLKRHYGKFTDSKDSGKSQLSDEDKELASALYEMLHEKHGYYPEKFINGEIIWATRPLSAVQRLAMDRADEWDKKGKAAEKLRGVAVRVKGKVGSAAKVFKGKKIKGYDENIPKVQR
jgi:hypothetical protein